MTADIDTLKEKIRAVCVESYCDGVVVECNLEFFNKLINASRRSARVKRQWREQRNRPDNTLSKSEWLVLNGLYER